MRPSERLEPTSEVVGCHEVGEVCSQLFVVFVVEPFHGRFFDRSVHPFHLAICPRMVGLGQSVLDAVRLADHVEAHWPGVDGVPVPGPLGELDVPRHCPSDQWRSNGSIGKNRADLVGHGLRHVLQELPRRLPVGRRNELGDGELGSAVDAHEEVELAFGGLHLRDIDVDRASGSPPVREPSARAEGIPLEFLALGLVTFDIR